MQLAVLAGIVASALEAIDGVNWPARIVLDVENHFRVHIELRESNQKILIYDERHPVAQNYVIFDLADPNLIKKVANTIKEFSL